MNDYRRAKLDATGNFEDGITRVRMRNDQDGWPELAAGLPDGIELRSDESPEQRAFRRFPITAHKPGRLTEVGDGGIECIPLTELYGKSG